MPTKKPPRPETRITIAIDGDGVTPADVGLRQLAALLEATAAALDAVAEERKIDPPRLSLAKVKHGSAAYELASVDARSARVVQGFVTTVRRRGKGASPRTRSALHRLHSVAAKTGALRLDLVRTRADVEPQSIYVASPVENDDTTIEEGTVIFGRVVGIKLDAFDRASVTMRYDDGGQGQFDADANLVDVAAHMIGRHVAARVTFLRGEERDFEGAIEHLEERPPLGSFMEAIEHARQQLDEEGVQVDAAAWLGEEREG